MLAVQTLSSRVCGEICGNVCVTELAWRLLALNSVQGGSQRQMASSTPTQVALCWQHLNSHASFPSSLCTQHRPMSAARQCSEQTGRAHYDVDQTELPPVSSDCAGGSTAKRKSSLHYRHYTHHMPQNASIHTSTPMPLQPCTNWCNWLCKAMHNNNMVRYATTVHAAWH